MISFAYPFSLTSQGSIATTGDPNVVAETRIQSLIGTYPGERVMQSLYGVDVMSYLFTPDIVQSTDLLANDVSSAISTWEPSLNVISIQPSLIQSDVGAPEINIEFSISNDPAFTPTQVATVLVGGKVVSN